MPSSACKKIDRKSTRLNSSHLVISYAVLCLKKHLWHARREETAEERLKLLAIPPAVDEPLPEADRSFREDAAVEAFGVVLGVLCFVSTERETRPPQYLLENVSA